VLAELVDLGNKAAGSFFYSVVITYSSVLAVELLFANKSLLCHCGSSQRTCVPQ